VDTAFLYYTNYNCVQKTDYQPILLTNFHKSLNVYDVLFLLYTFDKTWEQILINYLIFERFLVEYGNM